METNLCYGRSMKSAEITEQAKLSFARFVSARTLNDAVASLLPILGTSVLEPKKVSCVWGGTFEFDYVYFSKGEERNYERLMKKIKPGQTAVVVVGNEIVVVRHVPKQHEQGGSTKAHLHFSKGITL